MAAKTKKPPKRRKPIAKEDPQPSEENDAESERLKIEGLKYFAMLRRMLDHLHDDRCERDKAGNRKLHYDQYCMLILLSVLNPTVSSLRALSQASKLTKVRKKLGTDKVAIGSLSEASRLFDADRLKEIVARLSSQVQATHVDERLDDVPGKLTAVDGSLINALPSMIKASILKQTCGSGVVKWRLHTHFEVGNHVPSRIDVTSNSGGADDERLAMLQDWRCPL